MTSVWGVSAVAILDSSVNCVCVWPTKRLTMPAYCVAANCNNSQTTSGITMHELPCNRPTVRRKWIKFIQFKQADFLAPHHTHFCICSQHFSECDFATPMEYRMGFASKLTLCSGTLSKSCLTGSNWYSCILVGLLGKASVSSSELEWPFCSDSPEWRSRHMVTWFGRHGDAFSTTENAFFSCIYNPQITVSPTSSFSASFNGNRVKNQP